MTMLQYASRRIDSAKNDVFLILKREEVTLLALFLSHGIRVGELAY
jgi:hypothetical protein